MSIITHSPYAPASCAIPNLTIRPTSTNTTSTWNYVGLMPHFEHEETMFAPLWHDLNRDDLRARFENEHAVLRAMHAAPEYDNPLWNVEFATLLRDHARFEERELFPAIEKLLPPAG